MDGGMSVDGRAITASRLSSDGMERWFQDFTTTEQALGITWTDAGIERARKHLLNYRYRGCEKENLRPIGYTCLHSEVAGRKCVPDNMVVIVAHLRLENDKWVEVVRPYQPRVN